MADDDFFYYGLNDGPEEKTKKRRNKKKRTAPEREAAPVLDADGEEISLIPEEVWGQDCTLIEIRGEAFVFLVFLSIP